MDVREKLVEFLDVVQQSGYTYTPSQVDDRYGYRKDIPNTKVADHLIAHGVTVQEWISVKDRLPGTAERVLVCRTWLGTVFKPVYGYYQDFPNQKGCWYILTDEGYFPQREVTHWMPLPPAPKGE